MLKQYKVYVNFIEKEEHAESVHTTYELAMEHVGKVRDSADFTKDVKNIFITEEGYDKDTGEMLLEEDIYCFRNETWYNTFKIQYRNDTIIKKE